MTGPLTGRPSVRLWEAVLADLHTVLRDAQSTRDDRRHLPSPGPGIPGWLEAEVDAMHTAVNRLRAALDKPPIDRAAVAAADSLAAGHIDYGVKFVVGCADLVVYNG